MESPSGDTLIGRSCAPTRPFGTGGLNLRLAEGEDNNTQEGLGSASQETRGRPYRPELAGKVVWMKVVLPLSGNDHPGQVEAQLERLRPFSRLAENAMRDQR